MVYLSEKWFKISSTINEFLQTYIMTWTIPELRNERYPDSGGLEKIKETLNIFDSIAVNYIFLENKTNFIIIRYYDCIVKLPFSAESPLLDVAAFPILQLFIKMYGFFATHWQYINYTIFQRPILKMNKTIFFKAFVFCFFTFLRLHLVTTTTHSILSQFTVMLLQRLVWL